MAWTTINELTTGSVPATHFNTLVDDGDFLDSLTTQSNAPCPAVHGDTLSALNSGNHVYVFRHRLRYLHYEVENLTNTLSHLRIFYNTWKVAQDPTPAVTPFAGSVNLYNAGSFPNYVGAWATSTGYEANVGGDGEIVGNGGAYYKCKLNHTSSAGDEPGVGASWTTYWTLYVPPTIGTFCQAYVDAAFGSGSGELAVNYLIEREYA